MTTFDASRSFFMSWLGDIIYLVEPQNIPIKYDISIYFVDVASLVEITCLELREHLPLLKGTNGWHSISAMLTNAWGYS